MPDFSLVLPVVDEADIIETVVADIEKVLKKAKIDYELILVENESKDNTLQVLQKIKRLNKRLCIVQTHRGYGSAVLKGLEVARGTYAGYMPSDGQISPEILPILLKEAQKNRYDIVKIIRKNRESIQRFIRSKIFNILAHLLYGIKSWDINGSPRIFLRKLLLILDLRYKDSFIDTEFAVKSGFLKLKIKEFPIVNLHRAGGISTVKIATNVEFLRNLLFFRFGNRLKEWKKVNFRHELK